MTTYKVDTSTENTERMVNRADTLTGTAAENKAAFDRYPTNIADKYNSFVDYVVDDLADDVSTNTTNIAANTASITALQTAVSNLLSWKELTLYESESAEATGPFGDDSEFFVTPPSNWVEVGVALRQYGTTEWLIWDEIPKVKADTNGSTYYFTRLTDTTSSSIKRVQMAMTRTSETKLEFYLNSTWTSLVDIKVFYR